MKGDETLAEKREVFMKDMTWPEIKERLGKTDIAMIPAGQTEQHGHHLPIDVDNFICTGIAQRVAEATLNSAAPVVAPTIPFGYSDIPYFRDYPGTFSLQGDTLVNVYVDIAKSLVRMGFKKIIFINGHYPNPPFIDEAIRRVTKETGAFMALCNFFIIPAQEVSQILTEQGQPPVWGHACLIETSVSEVFGAVVREDKLQASLPSGFPKELADFVPVSPAGITIPAYEYKKTAHCQWLGGPENGAGPQGTPHGYSKDIGERVIKATVEPIVKLMEDIKDMPVELNPEFVQHEKVRG